MTTELDWICASIETTANRRFFLLTKTLPEDMKLREDLRQKRQDAVLQRLLEQKRCERADTTTSRKCLFCRKTFQGNPHELFQHMYLDHNFNVGRADNLVYVDDFLSVLREKLGQLICLHCEKTFKSWDVLKEHMRKKQHKHINPNNTMYDKFYIVSYLFGEGGGGGGGGSDEGSCGSARWTERDLENDLDDGHADKFEDWTEEQKFALICLFCDRCDRRWDEAFAHMKHVHHFDFDNIRKGLGFYDQVKVVNYIRRQTHINVCYLCEAGHSSRKELLEHLDNKHKDGGTGLSKSQWDQPGYFFPTYENDQLLLALEDDLEEGNEEWVVPEDTVEPNTELLRQLSLCENTVERDT